MLQVLPLSRERYQEQIVATITYEQLADPDLPLKLIGDSHVQGLVRIQLADADVIMEIRHAIFNIITWRIYMDFDIPILSSYIIKKKPITADYLADNMTAIMKVVRKKYPKIRRELNDSLFRYVNDLYNFVITELNAYTSSLSVLGLAKLMVHPEVEKIIKFPYRIEMGTDVIEKKITEANKQLQKVLRDRTKIAPEDNILLSYMEARQVNTHQLPQMLIAYGPRTDVDDTIIMYPVMTGAVEGLKSILDYATESLSCKKSAFYNKVAVTRSQYWGRKQHLLTSVLLRIYEGDCGSTALVKFKVKPENKDNLLGIFALNEQTNQLYELTEDNVDALVGTTILIRNPGTCRHRDGICEVCGGTLTYNIDHNVNIGMLSTIQVVSPTTQKILSAKHLIKTISMIYALNKEASKYFIRINANEIHWKPETYKHLKHWSLGVPLKDMGTLQDIIVLNPDNGTREERFSRITSLVIRDDRTGKTATLDMNSADEEICPFFTMEMLVHIRDLFRVNAPVMDSDMLWLPLEGTEKFSIFKTLVVNDNMMKFVKVVTSTLSSKIAKFTSFSEGLEEICTAVYSKVARAHVTHISVILKAYLISSETDYRVPLVEDPEHVIFQTTSMILRNRAMGSQLAYEHQMDFFRTPGTYLVPRSDSVFDDLLNIGAATQAKGATLE